MTMTESTDATGAGTPATTPAARRRMTTTDLALVAAFAALTGAVAYLGGVPVGGAGVAITLQTFAIMLAGAVLGPLRGFAAASLYLAMGAVGLPVFSQHASGLAPFTGVSAGYLISFPLAALVVGALVKYAAGPRWKTSALVVFGCAMAGTALVNHPMGIVGMSIHQDVSLATAATWDAPFWLGDILKNALVALVAAEVHRAFPQLLHRR